MKSGFIFLREDNDVKVKWNNKVLVFDTVEESNLFKEMFPSIFENDSYLTIPETYLEGEYINFNDMKDYEFAEKLEYFEGILLS